MYRYRIVCSLASFVIFLVVILVVRHHGDTNRVIASGLTKLVIDSPEKAYQIWKEKKVKGRILVLFDSYPHAKGLISYNGEPQLYPSNFVEYSVFKNIIRRIYFVVPDGAWEEFRKQKEIRPIRDVPNMERGLYLFNLNGIPMIAVPMSAIPRISEDVLVYINNSVFNYTQAVELISQRKIASDIIISYQSDGR